MAKINYSSWLYELIGLDRPQYPNQPEAFLIDLLWNSDGSSLSTCKDLKTEDHRIAFTTSVSQDPPAASNNEDKKKFLPLPKQSIDYAQKGSTVGLVSGTPSGADIMRNFMYSLLAPRSPKGKHNASVPVVPQLTLLQNLRGLTGPRPAFLYKSIESTGFHGGANRNGYVAYKYLKCVQTYLDSLSESVEQQESFIQYDLLTQKLSDIGAQAAWEEYRKIVDKNRNIPFIQTTESMPIVQFKDADPSETPSILSKDTNSPFTWFWTSWETLTKTNGADSDTWINTLTLRRWTDWALCLLRTSMVLAYLWESRFYIRLHSALLKKDKEREAELRRLESFLQNGPIISDEPLIVIKDPNTSISSRDCSADITTTIAKGDDALVQLDPILGKSLPSHHGSLMSAIREWLTQNEDKCDQLRELNPEIQGGSLNKREFIRYSSLQRTTVEETPGYADFYYLSKTGSRGRTFWFEPGPEWLVVIASLTAVSPSTPCTLDDVMRNLEKMGIKIQRQLLVTMLENHGLTSDSPDADEAIIVRSGF